MSSENMKYALVVLNEYNLDAIPQALFFVQWLFGVLSWLQKWTWICMSDLWSL